MFFSRMKLAVFVGVLSLAVPALAQNREPVMDYATLLTAFDVRPDGRLQLESDNEPLTAVFLPKSAPVRGRDYESGLIHSATCSGLLQNPW